MLDPAPIWPAILDELHAGTEKSVIAWRFHQGLTESLAELATALAAEAGVDILALSGGVFQNRTLFEGITQRLREAGLKLLLHRNLPANDGGISLGQAVIGAARLMSRERPFADRS